MRRISAESLNHSYAAFIADQDERAEQFWTDVALYVHDSTFTVPYSVRDDLKQSIIVEVMQKLAKKRADFLFNLWLSGVIAHMKADMFREFIFEPDEEPFSQLGSESNGEYIEFEPTDAMFPVQDDSDFKQDTDRIVAASRRLDDVRNKLTKPADRQLFDMLRSGLSIAQAADQLGHSYSATQRRFARWKEKIID